MMKRQLDEGEQLGQKRLQTDDEMRNLIINYIPRSVDESQLQALFEQFGEIERIKLMTNPDGMTKCFGFVKYVNTGSATEAINHMNGYEINGKKLRVAYSMSLYSYISFSILSLHGYIIISAEVLKPTKAGERAIQGGGARKPPSDVFFSGFGRGFGREQLTLLAQEYGTVLDAKVLDPDKHEKGVGFVTFSDESEATKCIRHLNDLEFDLGGIKTQLVVRFASKKKGAASTLPSAQGGFNFQSPFGQSELATLTGLVNSAGPGGVDPNTVLHLVAALSNQQQPQQQNAPPAMAGGYNAYQGGGQNLGNVPPPAAGAPSFPPSRYPPQTPRSHKRYPPAIDGSTNVLFVRGFVEADEAEVLQLFAAYGCTQVC